MPEPGPVIFEEVDAANGKAEWDSKKETLKITARILDAEF